MRSQVRYRACWLLAVVSSLLVASHARAQEFVVVHCSGPGQCAYQRVYGVTLQGRDSVRLVAPGAAADPQAIKKADTPKINTLTGLYHEPKSVLVRVLNADGTLGSIVLPSRLPPSATTASAAMAGAVFECQTQPKGPARLQVPATEFVALLVGRPESAVVEFVKREVAAREAHPYRSELINGALVFAKDSPDLRDWREELKTAMRNSVASFRGGGVDPTRLEAVLDEGAAAMSAYRIVAGQGQGEDALEQELLAVRREFLERVAIAVAFKNADMHDAFLEELSQLGLARFARPELVAATGPALRASAQEHAQKASDLLRAKQLGRAFDEYRIASSRAPCDQRISGNYGDARVEFVNANAVQALPEYAGENRNKLRQIVRLLEGMGPGDPTPEARMEALRRIKDGEEMDAKYLPLQLQKAQFLVKVHELTAARDVVIGVERSVPLGQTELDEWLKLDGQIGSKLNERLEQAYKTAKLQMAAEQFDAALNTAQDGLVSDQRDQRLLYLAAISAAVQRDQKAARRYADDYFRIPVLGCPDAMDNEKNLLELYRTAAATEGQRPVEGQFPNWMSGRLYSPGEVYYDPLSGGFQPRVEMILMDEKSRNVRTDFHWNDYMVQSITTTEGSGRDQQVRRLPTTTVFEPVYDQKAVHMKAITIDAGASGAKKPYPLRYLNAPDFDPRLAQKFTGRMTTRGWAGNPFFHPFMWDGVYLFDFEYDDLGRIRKATPVQEGVARPSSQFVEPLTFTWDGTTNRLKSIDGARYHRVMTYDVNGRLTQEDIRYGPSKGDIRYTYDGMARQPSQATCDDEFFDKGHRVVTLKRQQR